MPEELKSALILLWNSLWQGTSASVRDGALEALKEREPELRAMLQKARE